MDPAALIADLDDDQRRAVVCEHRLVAVIAGAGSGKTRVLTRRTAYRIATGDADAAHTLLLTFTREAAGEMRRRLPRLGIEEPVMAGTFHSICRQLLQQRWHDRGERAPTLRSDRRRILAEALDRPNDLSELLVEVDVASSHGWNATQYLDAVRQSRHRPRIESNRAAEAIERYRSVKRQRHIVDLDDLLHLTVEALEADASFADATRWRFRHLLVDEAQDLNPLQHRFIDAMRSGADDLFLVGDPAQAIYSFTGSDPTLLTDVASRFPGVEIIRLPTNHRSTPQIVDAGRYVLQSAGLTAAIVAGRDHAQPVEIIGHGDEGEEASAVAAAVGAVDPHLLRRSDVAVLARTHATLDRCKRELAALGVPVTRVATSAQSAIAPHVRTLFRCSHSNQIRQWAQDHREQANEDGDSELAVVVQAALDFLRERPTGIGADFEAWVDLNDPFDEQTAGAELLTFHAAKGREWHTVFLIGCETSLVPHRSATTKALRAEEARLLYVALTRGTDRVVVSWAARRNGYQRRLSPFLDGFVSNAVSAVAPPAYLFEFEPDERELALERLRRWRAGVARTSDILPTQVVTDHDLTLIADHRPDSAEALAELTGIGRITASKLFDGVRLALTHAGRQ